MRSGDESHLRKGFNLEGSHAYSWYYKESCLFNGKGTEYYFSLFNEFYKQHWILHETTAPYFPEMNGKADRKNRNLTELVVVIMFNSGVASHYGGKFVDYLLCPE